MHTVLCLPHPQVCDWGHVMTTGVAEDADIVDVGCLYTGASSC